MFGTAYRKRATTTSPDGACGSERPRLKPAVRSGSICSGADALRTAIAKACRAAGVPAFSPHDLRHRRVTLLHLRGVPWARIGELVGQRDLAVTANTYTHVIADETELDYANLLR